MIIEPEDIAQQTALTLVRKGISRIDAADPRFVNAVARRVRLKMRSQEYRRHNDASLEQTISRITDYRDIGYAPDWLLDTQDQRRIDAFCQLVNIPTPVLLAGWKDVCGYPLTTRDRVTLHRYRHTHKAKPRDTEEAA